jgi:hypothetical protein
MQARTWQPRGQCSVEGCTRESESGGWCGMHRWRVRQHGDPGPAENLLPGRTPALRQECAVEGCDRFRKGASPYCHLHQERLRRTGEVGPAQPTRAKGVVNPRSDGYRRLTLENGRRVLEHVHVKEQELGRRLAPGENVHHKNGIKDDNDPDNLELWVKMQPTGQRVTDLMEYIAEYHAAAMLAMLAGKVGQ